MNRDSHGPRPRSDHSSDLLLGYGELLRALFHGGFTRVERDDRLLDIFPDEDREKGVELWEQWQRDTVQILRVRLPFDPEKLQLFTLPRQELEGYLQDNHVKELSQQLLVAEGEAAAQELANE